MDSNEAIQSDRDTNSILGDNADIDVNDVADAADNSCLFRHPLAIFTFAIWCDHIHHNIFLIDGHCVIVLKYIPTHFCNSYHFNIQLWIFELALYQLFI